jgi:hypothetical protein
VELVELGEGGLEDEVAARGLELLHEVGGAGVEDAKAGLDQGMADGAQDVGLAGTAVADGNEIGAAVDPVTGGERFDAAPRQVGQHLEVEGRQRFAAWQLGLGEVTLDLPGFALGELAFGEGGEELGGRPALLVGTFGEVLPVHMDAWQAQRGEHRGQLVDVDLTSGHGRAAKRPSKLASTVSATGTSSGSSGSCRWRRSRSWRASGRWTSCPWPHNRNQVSQKPEAVQQEAPRVAA